MLFSVVKQSFGSLLKKNKALRIISCHTQLPELLLIQHEDNRRVKT